METFPKPYQIRICLILMTVVLVHESIFLIKDMPVIANYFKIRLSASYAFGFAWLFFNGFLLYEIYKARIWARWLWTLLFIFSSFTFYEFDYERYPAVLAFITTLVNIAGIIAFVLLWNPASTRWFKAMKAERAGTSEATRIDETEISENTDDNKQNQPASPILSSEKSSRKMSYNKILKILRAIRVIYILAITQVLMNIATFYGVAVNNISRFPMPQNTETLIGVNRSVFVSLEIILLISLVYMFVENIFDKKLQSYPQERIDRSYSPKAIFFLSFLYIFFFFSLNYRIIFSFVCMNNNYRLGIDPAFYLFLMNLPVPYFVFRYLIRKIEDKKTWRNYWIAAICAFPFMMFFVNFSEEYMVYFRINVLTSKPLLTVINILVPLLI